MTHLVQELWAAAGPRTPWWVMPGVFLAGLGTNVAVFNLLYLFLPFAPSAACGMVACVVAMLLCARWYDTRQKKKRAR